MKARGGSSPPPHDGERLGMGSWSGVESSSAGEAIAMGMSVGTTQIKKAGRICGPLHEPLVQVGTSPTLNRRRSRQRRGRFRFSSGKPCTFPEPFSTGAIPLPRDGTVPHAVAENSVCRLSSAASRAGTARRFRALLGSPPRVGKRGGSAAVGLRMSDSDAYHSPDEHRG
jgi:hypothetical protein